MPRMVLLALLTFVVGVHAFEPELGPATLTEAIATGQTGLAARRADFHRPYRLLIGQPPLDYIDIVTPFRKVALAAEARMLAGERLFGQRDGLAVLGDRPEQVELRLELTFHPLNTFVGVPAYDVRLESVRDQRRVDPRTVERIPRFGPRVEGLAPPSPTQGVGLLRGQTQPLLGGTIVATFDGRTLDAVGAYEVVISQDGGNVAGGRIEFSRLR